MLGLQTALPLAWQVLSPTLRPERIFALMSAQPAAIAGLTLSDARRAGHSRARRAGRGRCAANLCVFDPLASTVVEVTPGQPEPQHALSPEDLHRCRAPHDPAGRTGGYRRRGAAMSPRSVHRPCW